MKREKNTQIILSLVFFAFSLIMLFPLLYMIFGSLKTPAEVYQSGLQLLPEEPTFSGYVKVFSSGMCGRWIFNSLFISIVVTICSLLANSIAGFAMARLNFRFKKVVYYSILFGLMIQPQIIMIPVFLMLKRVPLVGGNDLWGYGGSGLIDTYLGMMIVQFVGAFGIFLCRQYYMGISRSLDEAAKIDGCSYWQIYFKIYLPLSAPIFGSLGMIKFTSVWNDYIWPLALTSSEKMRTLPLAIALLRSMEIEWPSLMAACSIVVLPIIVLFAFTQKLFISNMTEGSVKG